LFPNPVQAKGIFLAKDDLVVCGLDAARAVFDQIDPAISFEPIGRDGSKSRAGGEIARVAGDVRGILKGERTALNFLQRLSGIATLTARFASEVAGTGADIIDTRKTTPGLRLLEKEAVRAGGGKNHRFNLGEMILIKDNHIALAGGVVPAVAAAKRVSSHPVRIEVEVKNLSEIEEALSAGAEILLLDNMDVKELAQAVPLIRKKAPATLIEASGGVHLKNVREIAESGVDLISIGALTHSAPAVDISLEVASTS
jgi:nicotinate-nucleotide pyrophosphorylase (carboxylating)